MSHKKLIIIEGAQGVGKTTVTRIIREQLPYTVLMSLSGVQDKTENGSKQVYREHDKCLDMIFSCRFSDLNFILDRSFITEKIYCSLGYKEYDFKMEYYNLLRKYEIVTHSYDAQIVVLTATEPTLEERLNRDKAQYSDVKFCIDNSLNQQRRYIEHLEAINSIYKDIKWSVVSTDFRDPNEIAKRLIESTK